MHAIHHLQDDLAAANIDIGCCASFVDSPPQLEYHHQDDDNDNDKTSKPSHKQPNRRPSRRLSLSSVSTVFKQSSKNLMTSFSKSLTIHTNSKAAASTHTSAEEEEDHPTIAASGTKPTGVTAAVLSPAEAAKLVAAEYFANEKYDRTRGEYW